MSQIVLDMHDFVDGDVKVKLMGEKELLVEALSAGSSRTFRRSFSLPESTDMTSITPVMSSDGILTITVTKKETEKHNRRRLSSPLASRKRTMQKFTAQLPRRPREFLRKRRLARERPTQPNRGTQIHTMPSGEDRREQDPNCSFQYLKQHPNIITEAVQRKLLAVRKTIPWPSRGEEASCKTRSSDIRRDFDASVREILKKCDDSDLTLTGDVSHSDILSRYRQLRSRNMREENQAFCVSSDSAASRQENHSKTHALTSPRPRKGRNHQQLKTQHPKQFRPRRRKISLFTRILLMWIRWSLGEASSRTPFLVRQEFDAAIREVLRKWVSEDSEVTHSEDFLGLSHSDILDRYRQLRSRELKEETQVFIVTSDNTSYKDLSHAPQRLGSASDAIHTPSRHRLAPPMPHIKLGIVFSLFKVLRREDLCPWRELPSVRRILQEVLGHVPSHRSKGKLPRFVLRHIQHDFDAAVRDVLNRWSDDDLTLTDRRSHSDIMGRYRQLRSRNRKEENQAITVTSDSSSHKEEDARQKATVIPVHVEKTENSSRMQNWESSNTSSTASAEATSVQGKSLEDFNSAIKEVLERWNDTDLRLRDRWDGADFLDHYRQLRSRDLKEENQAVTVASGNSSYKNSKAQQAKSIPVTVEGKRAVSQESSSSSTRQVLPTNLSRKGKKIVNASTLPRQAKRRLLRSQMG
ncbi:hypothetical protein C7M84_019872 [Penaeus vannamei]|uniref:SHSP domain-containing protein n=1 Tax=Penaeus vannamei TaxID=6689 RepID=A0A3R7SIB7_PENVA|nr:hypothetical protein C7M84_019872 [Penaeus vannamei]